MGPGSVRVSGDSRRSTSKNKVAVKGLGSGKGKPWAANDDVEINHEEDE